MITHRIRECFSKVFEQSPEALGLEIVYDVAHNIAKRERYSINGKERELLVHRKGATRSFGPGEDLPVDYREVGQPVIVGGSMETGSYLLIGTTRSQEETFGSTLHGSGRTMSRKAAQKRIRGRELLEQMEQKGIVIRTASLSGLAEEAGFAYKDISEVVQVVDQAGLSRKVAQLIPIGNIKG
jgi:tRNA-splicing ligase RtcB